MSQPTSGRATPQSAAQSASQAQSAASLQKIDKRPALAGAKTTQRKGVAKAQAKFEPSVFRDDLIRSLSAVDSKDYEGYIKLLENLANELDFRKYEAQLFELLILGRLLAPGGNLSNEGEECPLSVVGRDISEVREIAGVFEKLIRRYKYLQRPLESSSLPSILQNANKLDKPATAAPTASAPTLAVPGLDGDFITPGEGNAISGTSTPVSASKGSLALPTHPRPAVEKLAAFTAVMISSGLNINPAVLSSMKRDHLVKDGTSLAFLTAFLKSYMAPVSTGSGCGETIDSLSSMLRKLNLADLLDFFPLQKRSISELQKEFKDKKVDPKITEWYLKLVETWKNNAILRKLEELTDDSGQGRAGNEELINYLSTEAKPATNMADADFIVLVWQGLMSNMTAMTEEKEEKQVKEIVLNWVKTTDSVLAEFTKGARTEIALINAIQLYIYNNTHLLSIFPKIIQILYNDDILSSAAIFYWFEKGAKGQGKQSMLKVMEPLVKAIREAEESDEDEE